MVTASAAAARAALAEVRDPEIPVLTIEDLGILRRVSVDGESVEVEITPTYLGCPAMDMIRADAEAVLRRLGFAHIQVRTVLSPAWSTASMPATARRKLSAAGIAPPPAAPPPPAGLVTLPLRVEVRCPHCGSADTEERSHFSSTACTALYRCLACREPFQHFKAH